MSVVWFFSSKAGTGTQSAPRCEVDGVIANFVSHSPRHDSRVHVHESATDIDSISNPRILQQLESPSMDTQMSIIVLDDASITPKPTTGKDFLVDRSLRESTNT